MTHTLAKYINDVWELTPDSMLHKAEQSCVEVCEELSTKSLLLDVQAIRKRLMVLDSECMSISRGIIKSTSGMTETIGQFGRFRVERSLPDTESIKRNLEGSNEPNRYAILYDIWVYEQLCKEMRSLKAFLYNRGETDYITPAYSSLTQSGIIHNRNPDVSLINIMNYVIPTDGHKVLKFSIADYTLYSIANILHSVRLRDIYRNGGFRALAPVLYGVGMAKVTDKNVSDVSNYLHSLLQPEGVQLSISTFGFNDSFDAQLVVEELKQITKIAVPSKTLRGRRVVQPYMGAYVNATLHDITKLSLSFLPSFSELPNLIALSHDVHYYEVPDNLGLKNARKIVTELYRDIAPPTWFEPKMDVAFLGSKEGV